MKIKGYELPDFAGVALVDILANGLAMLIIVIVLSIASRAEYETQSAEQVQQVETMMSRRVSTSLVLNSLAASPPARLHDYDTSPLDQIHDTNLLPIIELHNGFVREYYTGAVWTRSELLREPNAMDGWLSGFSDDRKRRLRIDVYDVAQFYLAMSILRDHGIKARHWHFLTGGLNVADAGRCPPGIAAKDCEGYLNVENPSTLTALPSELSGDISSSETWPPSDSVQPNNPATQPGAFPGGASLGFGESGSELNGDTGEGSGSGSGYGDALEGGSASFPNARPGDGRLRGLLGTAGGGQGQPGNTRFRLSSPESLHRDGSLSLGDSDLTPQQILTVLLDFIGQLQEKLDAGGSPSILLANFELYLQRAFTSPPDPPTDNDARSLLDLLLLQIWAGKSPLYEAKLPVISLIRPQFSDVDIGGVTDSDENGATHKNTTTDTTLIVQTNERLQDVIVQQSPQSDARDDILQFPETARPRLHLNAHPDIWRGLALELERDALLVLPPKPQRPGQLRWRAVAYVAPDFDDFIIGFVHASVDDEGQLVLQVEDNRARLDAQPLRTIYQQSWFGARGWLATLYGGLTLCLLGVLFLVRRLITERDA